jgi:hypothetical protein
VSLRNNAKKDTYRHKKESFPDPGEGEKLALCQRKKIWGQIPSVTLLQAHKRIKWSHLHPCFCVKLFFSYWARNSAKKRLKGPECVKIYIQLITFHQSPPTSAKTLRERWNMIIDSARIECLAKEWNLQLRTLRGTLLCASTKTCRNWWALACRSSKSHGFFTPYLAGMLKTMIAIGGHHWGLITAYSHVLEP